MEERFYRYITNKQSCDRSSTVRHLLSLSDIHCEFKNRNLTRQVLKGQTSAYSAYYVRYNS